MVPQSYLRQQQFNPYINSQNGVVTYSRGEAGTVNDFTQTTSKPDIVYASSTVSPLNKSPASQFEIQKSVEPINFAHQEPIYSAPAVQYYPQQYRQPYYTHQPTSYYPSVTQPNTGIRNYFGYQYRQPNSLLDSYVPSSLLLRGNSYRKPYYQPINYQTTNFLPSASTNYNTIAYSVPSHYRQIYRQNSAHKRTANGSTQVLGQKP